MRLTNMLRVFLVTLTVIVMSFAGCGEEKGPDGQPLPPTGPIYTGGAPGPSDGDKRTNKGVLVRAKQGSVKTEWFSHIDAGLDKAFAIAKAEPNNYSGFSEHPNFIVALWPRSPRCTNPGYLVNADGSPHYSTGQGWDNHPTYDKDPREGYTLLCVAGLTQYTTGYGGQSGGTYGMVVVDDIGLLQTIVWFEGEHEVLFQADHAKWLATKGVHAHPINGYGPDPQITVATVPETIAATKAQECMLLTH